MFYTTNTLNDLFFDLNKVINNDYIQKHGRNQNIEKFQHYIGLNYNTETTDDGVTLTMEVPGYNKNLIDVTVEDKTLVVEGKSNSGDADGFKERFTLNDKFNGDGVEATIVDGMLTVLVPYKEAVKPHKVKVKIG